MIWATSPVKSHRRNALDSRPARRHCHGSFQTPTTQSTVLPTVDDKRTNRRPMRAPMNTPAAVPLSRGCAEALYAGEGSEAFVVEFLEGGWSAVMTRGR
jgi:hypothetical protein